jgi:hypothetical protein
MADGNHGWDGMIGASQWAGAASRMNAGHLAGMIGDVGGAISKENDSRVAQSREMKRMQNEINKKQMELDALLKRIEAARTQAGPQPRASFRGGAIY